MKHILPFLLVAASFSTATAQNDPSIYVDAGLFRLGINATYDKKITKHLDLGLGMNSYINPLKYKNIPRVSSALYFDVRPNWNRRKSTTFLFLDPGVAFHADNRSGTESVTPVGIYFGMGLGYQYKINEKGIGPYISAGLNSNYLSYHNSNSALRPSARDYGVLDAYAGFSLGFKF